MSTPALVFISYSHKDEADKEALVSHLGVLEKAKLMDLWVDDRIGAGGDWTAEIELASKQARVAILLISANFLTSQFILGTEVPRLLERRQSEGLVVFPVIARPCAWKNVDWLVKMNVRPKNGAPVWRDGGRYADEELAKIAEEVAKIIGQATQPNQSSAPPLPTGQPSVTASTTSADAVSEVRLFETMKTTLSSQDFIELCFILGIKHDNLPGQSQGLPVLLMELIGYCKRRGRYAELVEQFIKMRPERRDELFS